MRRAVLVAMVVALLGVSGVAQATTITFSEFAAGTLISNQYAALGVTFGAGAIGHSLPIIANDGAMPNSPVLSPNPPFGGDFDIYFGGGASGVSFASGYWDTVRTAIVRVYDLSNNLLATLTNQATGAYTFDLSAYGTIGHIYFNSFGDPAGGDIDNLTFTVPEPTSLLLLGSGLVGLAAFARRKRQ